MLYLLVKTYNGGIWFSK